LIRKIKLSLPAVATEGDNKTLGSYTPEKKGSKYPRR
tara:strand:+ start:184 stop:294 length:111 start_codon:yes stop_codon:yes gene_type:complete